MTLHQDVRADTVLRQRGYAQLVPFLRSCCHTYILEDAVLHRWGYAQVVPFLRWCCLVCILEVSRGVLVLLILKCMWWIAASMCSAILHMWYISGVTILLNISWNIPSREIRVPHVRGHVPCRSWRNHWRRTWHVSVSSVTVLILLLLQRLWRMTVWGTDTLSMTRNIPEWVIVLLNIWWHASSIEVCVRHVASWSWRWDIVVHVTVRSLGLGWPTLVFSFNT